MITFFGTLLRSFLQIFRSKRIILSENALLKKENDILLRRVGKKRVLFAGVLFWVGCFTTITRVHLGQQRRFCTRTEF